MIKPSGFTSWFNHVVLPVGIVYMHTYAHTYRYTFPPFNKNLLRKTAFFTGVKHFLHDLLGSDRKVFDKSTALLTRFCTPHMALANLRIKSEGFGVLRMSFQASYIILTPKCKCIIFICNKV